MYNNYDYPMGADNERAPWNEEGQPEREFDVIVTQTLEKREKVTTCDYGYYREQNEDGWIEEFDTEDTDWNKAWADQCWSIPELLNALKNYAEDELSSGQKMNRGRQNYLKGMIAACQGWNVIETDVEEE